MTTTRVTVPVEPTPKMLAATWDHEIDQKGGVESQNTRNARIWSAMLSAAPAPEGGAVDYRVRTEGAPGITEPDPAIAIATREEAPAEAGDIKNFAAFMAEDGALRAQPPAREDAQPVWVDGVPTKHHAKEWFIAETTFGDRVVLTALPEEYAYDFKTADETYIKADRIKRWMPFPDSQYLFPHPAPDALRVAISDIAAERQRQVDVEGWSEAHDDEHDDYQMARAAGCYAFHAGRVDDDDAGMFVNAAVRHGWPWDRAWWKPKSRRADLVRAGALIVAEIERLDRAALQAEQGAK